MDLSQRGCKHALRGQGHVVVVVVAKWTWWLLGSGGACGRHREADLVGLPGWDLKCSNRWVWAGHTGQWETEVLTVSCPSTGPAPPAGCIKATGLQLVEPAIPSALRRASIPDPDVASRIPAVSPCGDGPGNNALERARSSKGHKHLPAA
jgi:hypothetical protein